MTYSVSVERVFRAGHYLCYSSGHREAFHAHDWRVRVTVGSAELDGDGMVIDFHELERLLEEVVRPLEDVRAVNDLPAFQDRSATAERIAGFLSRQVAGGLPETVVLESLELWEAPGCRVICR